MYVNGSRCDLNGKSRETEVRVSIVANSFKVYIRSKLEIDG